MGGGKKQSQRTKGNVKPSSSSKAAERLVQDGRTGFIGFKGLSESMGNAFGYVPKIVGMEEEDELKIDSELRMLMRKMGKKDTITKLKAVQEFSQLCTEKDSDDIIKILSFWPRLYNRLSEDYDHRVREAIQLAQLNIASKVGRNLAPQLKLIICSWLKSQFDQFAPAASAAKKSFDVTFPGDKKKDVLSHCKQDLVMNFHDILIKQTKDTLSDPRVIPIEEREAKYNRIISATLLSLGCMMEMLQKDDIVEISEQCENIFSEKRFWKFSKHSSPMIRSAFFTVLSSLCHHNVEILHSHASVIFPTVLCSIDESDPTVVGAFWECLLHTVSAFEDCWSHVNARKAVLPKLWSVLRKGGFGNAVIIFPNILPFLSKIPKSVIGDGVGFAKEFFTNMKEGLCFDKVASSFAESIAVMKSYMECLRFMLFNIGSEKADESKVDNDEERRDSVVDYLINEELGFLIESSMGVKRRPWRTTFLAALRDLVVYIETQTVNNEAMNITHCLLRKLTLSFLNDDSGQDENDMRIKFHNFEEFIKTVLFKKDQANESQKKCVGFLLKDTGMDKGSWNVSRTSNDHSIVSSNVESSRLQEWTKDLLKDISLNCIELLFERENIIFLEFVSDVISFIDNKDDFQELLAHTMKSRQSLEEKIPQFQETGNLHDDIISNIIQPIISADSVLGGSYWESADCQVAVVGLLCRMLAFTGENQRQGFLGTLTKISSKPYMFSLLVQKVLRTVGEDCLIAWFKTYDIWSRVFTFTLEQFTVELSNDKNKDIFNSVFQCIQTCLFFQNGLLCTTSAVEKLFEIFRNQLVSGTLVESQFINKCITSLIAEFFSKENSLSMLSSGTMDILISVFHLMIKVDDDDDVIEQARLALSNGIKLFSRSADKSHHRDLENVIQKIAYLVQNSLTEEADLKSIQCHAYSAGQLINILTTVDSENATLNYSEAFLSQLTRSIKRYLNSTDFSSQTSVLDAVILGTLSIMNLPKEPLPSGTCSSYHLNNALFAVLLFKGMDTFPVNCETLINSIVDSLCVLCLASKDANDENDIEALNVMENLEINMKELLIKNGFPSEMLLNSALDRALHAGGLATLALKRLFSLTSESVSSKFPVSDLLGRAMSHGQNTSNSLDGLKLILSHVEDLSIIRALVEQYVDQICNENVESLQGFSYALDLCLTSIVRWQCMTGASPDLSRDLDDIIQAVLTRLIGWRDSSQDSLLFSVDLTDATDEQIALNINIMKLLSFSLDCGGANKFDSYHWDFILCSLASWIQTCEENVTTMTSSFRKMAFTIWVCNLCSSVNKAFNWKIGGNITDSDKSTIQLKCKAPWLIKDGELQNVTKSISDDLVTEWQEFFTPAIFKGIYSLYRQLLDDPAGFGSNKFEGNSTMLTSLLKSICCSFSGMPSTLLLDIVLENDTFEEQLQRGSLPDASRLSTNDFNPLQIRMVQNTYNLFIDQLKSEVLSLQVLAHEVLCKLMVVSHSVALSLTTESVEGDECDTVRSFPDKLMDVLQASQDHILAYLDEHSAAFGFYMTQPPSNQMSQLILSFLLSWQMTLRLFRDSEAAHRAAYANFFRKRNMIGPLLTILFSLMPHDKGHLLTTDAVLVEGDWLSLGQIRQSSFHLFLAALECIPALIRSWYNNNLDKKSSIIIERFTTAFVSPILCNREIDQVSNSSKTFQNMSIKTRPTAREVVALYSVEEIAMELVVKMSPSHPLGPVVVECGKRVGVSSAQWRQWMLQLTMYLTQQNGTIVDGLALWKRNVDKKFEGVDECMICFSVVHGTNYQLPTITCRVCKKKYHSACLYKWFNTSNKSTCPLCRSSF